jgi:hypothetical protein
MIHLRNIVKLALTSIASFIYPGRQICHARGDCTLSVAHVAPVPEKPGNSTAFRSTVRDRCGDNAQYEVMDQTGNRGE